MMLGKGIEINIETNKRPMFCTQDNHLDLERYRFGVLW